MSRRPQLLYKSREKNHNARMKNYLVLHGHFYQPPREDPWTGAVPLQESAAPYHDWNKRITKECYAANSASRILDSRGRVQDIVNNYRYISFNFGPTLIQWLKKEAPNVYQRILEADAMSLRERRGHGNALAQGYNHTILPLDSPEDRKTQIVWGMEDFKSHFNRDPEGLWLPEAAVNNSVADELISQGIRFIVLSPWQGQSLRRDGESRWEGLHGKPVPSGRAYRLERPGGSLAVFFYNPALASGISFEHYLRNAEDLNRRFEAFAEPREGHLIHAATDGEIYGHHEPFGDMCLAAFSRIVQENSRLTWTNYGEYLELYPPRTEVELRLGEESRGSSWSCFHGVSRWYKDCGCSTGGDESWNQKWRGPLREAFQNLSAQISKIYQETIPQLTEVSPQELRNRYIDVLCGRTDGRTFATEVLSRDSREPAQQRRLLRLLEAQKYVLYTFTSCGWFFSEISGLEPTQNIRYAVKAIRLIQEYAGSELMDELAENLSRAASNIPDKGTGADILRDMILAEEQGPGYPAAVFLFRRAIHTLAAGKNAPQPQEAMGDYRCLEITPDIPGSKPAEITVEHRPTGEISQFTSPFPDLSALTPQAVELTNKSTGEGLRIPITILPSDLRQDLGRSLSAKLEESCRSHSSHVLPQLRSILDYAAAASIPVPRDIQHMAAMSLNCTIKGLLPPAQGDPESSSAAPSPLEPKALETIRGYLKTAREHQLDIDYPGIQNRFSHLIAREVELLRDNLSSRRIEYVFNLLQTGRESGIEPEMTYAQNKAFFLIKERQETCFRELKKESFAAWKKLKYLIRMGEIFGIDTDYLKKRLFQDP